MRNASLAALSSAALLAACSGSPGTAPAPAAPTITASIPPDGAPAVAATTALEITFSEPMASASLQLGIAPAATPDPSAWVSTWSSGRHTVRYEGLALEHGVTYTISVSGTSERGTALASGTVLHFTVGDRPTVVAHAPDGDEVSTSAPVSLTFSHAMLPSSVVVGLACGADTYELGSATWNAERTTVSIAPLHVLQPGAPHRLTVSGRDAVGNELVPVAFDFATGPPSSWVLDPQAVVTSGTGGYEFGRADGARTAWQTFVAPTPAPNLKAVDLVVRRPSEGGTPTDVEVQLFATVGGAPTGPALASAVIPASDVLPFAWRAVRAPLAYEGLVPGAAYAVVLGQLTPEATGYEWAGIAPGAGTFAFSDLSGTITDRSAQARGWLRPIFTDEALVRRGRISLEHTSALAASGFGALPGGAGQEVKRWQAFRAGDEQDIERVLVRIRRMQNTQSSASVELYATVDGRPAGAPLAFAHIPWWTVPTSFAVLGAPLAYAGLVSGDVYAIVLGQAEPGADRYEWAVANVDPTLTFGTFDQISWGIEPGKNGWLRVLTTGAPVAAPSVADVSSNVSFGNGFGMTSGEVLRYQTFVAPAAHLVAVDVNVRKLNAGTQSDVVVQLCQKLPTGVGGCSAHARIPAASIGTSFAVHRVYMDHDADGVTMRVGGEYAITLAQATPQADHYEWARSPTDARPSLRFGKYDGASWVDESGMGDAWLKVHFDDAPRTALVDASSDATTGVAFGDTAGSGRVLGLWQSFVMPEGYLNVDSVRAKLRWTGAGAQSDVVVDLHRTQGGVPTPAPIASDVIPAMEIGTTFTTRFAAPEFAGLLPGETYAIALRAATPQSPPAYEWCSESGDSTFSYGAWDGSEWTADPTGAQKLWLIVRVSR